MRIVLAGGTGFVGKPLIKRLSGSGHEVFLLTRNPKNLKLGPSSSVQVIPWDAKTLDVWLNCVDGADAVINLTGESIANKRWTQSQKRLIL